MTAALTAGLGACLGALGAVWHLVVVRWRAGLVTRGDAAWALLAFPLGLLGVAAAVLLAARLSPSAAWCTLPGVFAARSWLLHQSGARA